MNADDTDRKNPEEELPRMNGKPGQVNADDTDRKTGEQDLPRMDADRESGNKAYH
jgi:hypothetical protein